MRSPGVQLPRENRLFCSCLGLFAPSSCLQQLWGGRWKQLLLGLSSVAAGWGYSQQSCGLCPCSLLLPRPLPCSLTGFAVSFLSPLCHPWSSGLSVLLWGRGRAWHVAVPEWRHCRAPGVISCLLLSSGSSLPQPFPSSRTTPTPRCSGGRRVAVAAFQGGSPCRGTVPATVPARPALCGLCHLLARGQQCWATRWHN